MSSVCVYNEWDPIEELIVGNALYAGMPEEDRGFEAMQHGGSDAFEPIISGRFPQKIIEETEEDIQLLIDSLTQLNITVKRPEPISFEEKIKTLDWEANHFFCYCPRDVLLAIGDTIIETPNVMRSRYFETLSYKKILIDYMKSGARWLSAPKPRLLDDIFNYSNPSESVLKNSEPVFDAANIIRAGEDIFYLVSNSGNEMGCQWLQSIVGSHYRVHPCRNLYHSMHIDSTIALLRPGLALVNPSRVNDNNLPPLLKKWDLLCAPEMIEYRYSDLPAFSTPWLGMNLLMLSPHLAVVDKHQLPLIHLLEKNGIDVVPLLLRHGRTLGGGFHCITLDVRRAGKLERYF